MGEKAEEKEKKMQHIAENIEGSSFPSLGECDLDQLSNDGLGELYVVTISVGR